MIGRAINSILKQTYKPYEIIIVDDGSTDETKHFIHDEYPTIKYFCQSRSGVSKARNRGIVESKGDWIAFLDSDDEWLPNKLEKQKENLKQNPTILVSHTNEIWIRNGVRVNQMKKHQKYGGQQYAVDKPVRKSKNILTILMFFLSPETLLTSPIDRSRSQLLRTFFLASLRFL